MRAALAIPFGCLSLSACFISIADLGEPPDGGVAAGGEGATCAAGTLVACYEGPAETEAVGSCAPGARPCEEGGECAGQVLPAIEQYNSDEPSDEDCDGTENDHCGLWNLRIGGSSMDATVDIDVLPGGDVVVAGLFTGTADLAGRPLVGQGTTRDGFVGRLDPASGEHVASILVTGNERQNPRSLAPGGDDDLFVVGTFVQTIKIGTITRFTDATSAMFVARLDASDLSPHWLLGFGVADQEHEPEAVAATPDGGAVIAGGLTGILNLGNGVTIDATSGRDVFVAKVDVDGVGVWGRRFGGSDYDHAVDIVTDAAGASYVTGIFSDALDPGGACSALAAAGADYEAFVLKLDEAGDCAWAMSFGGEGQQRGRSLAWDGRTLYVFGDFQASTEVGGETVTSQGDRDLVVLALSPATGEVAWHRAFGDAEKQEAHSIAADPRGGFAIGASFKGQPDFGGGPLIASATDDDALLVLFDPRGEPRWARSFGYGGDDDVIDVAFAPGGGGLFIGGEFETGIDLGIGFLEGSAVDAFVARVDELPLGE